MSTEPPKHVKRRLWGDEKSDFRFFLQQLDVSLAAVRRERTEPQWLAEAYLNLIGWLAVSTTQVVRDASAHDVLFALLRHAYTSGCLTWFNIVAGYPQEARPSGRAVLEHMWMYELGCENPDYVRNWLDTPGGPTGGQLIGFLRKWDEKRYERRIADRDQKARRMIYRLWSNEVHPSRTTMILPLEQNADTETWSMRFGPIREAETLRGSEVRFLTILQYVTAMATRRSCACFPAIADSQELMAANRMLGKALDRYRSGLRAGRIAGTPGDTAST
jgi:hypothetical protein